MKIVAYLTEPASYTIDLVKAVHFKNDISVRYLWSKSFSNSQTLFKQSTPFLNQLSLIKRYKLLKKDYKSHDAIIFNGYDSITFLLLWLIHLQEAVKTPIAIESDTPLKIPKGAVKRAIKKIYLNYLFKNTFLHGLAGGTLYQKELFRYYGMSENRIHFLPMVIDVEKFRPFKAKQWQKTTPFNFLYVGRFLKLKQIHIIISEFLLEFENDPTTHLNLIGDGETFKLLSNRYSHFNNIHFKGKLENEYLLDEYQNGHVLILASNNENWGLVINEAMSCGIPVISNRGIGANFDLLEGKETGLIFDAQQEGDLASKMKFLKEDTKNYQHYSKNAYRLMHEYWNFSLYEKQLKIAVKKMIHA